MARCSRLRNPPPSSCQSPWKQTLKLEGKKNACCFLVFLGIYYFYGILDRQQKIKKKNLSIFAVKETSCSPPFKAPLVNLVETLLRIDEYSQCLTEVTWSCLELQ